MIEIETEPWLIMVQHAEAAYPNECCGALFGQSLDGKRLVTSALPLENAFTGSQNARYEVRSEDLLAADQAARARGLDLVGIFHSHPDCDAYFSDTDLRNSCPWFSFIVLSIQAGRFHHANSFLPDWDQTKAEKEEIRWLKS